MRPAAAGLTTRKKGDDRSSKVPEDAEEHEGMDKHGMRSLNRNICLTVGLIIAGTIAFVIYSSKPEIFAPTPQKLPAAVAKPTDASRNTSVHPVLHLPKASAAADRTSVSSAGSLKTEKPAEGLARHVHQSTPLVAVPAPRNHQEAAVPHSAPQSVTLPTAPFTPALVSLGRPATSNFKGNLAEPSVITNEKIDDWLKDRWQAAVDMSGTPYQGMPLPHKESLSEREMERDRDREINGQTSSSCCCRGSLGANRSRETLHCLEYDGRLGSCLCFEVFGGGQVACIWRAL